ncbi:DsbA family protein [Pedococcus sp. KACC 23699]|uniref:DsbA family protein n=1 Tax=Pedococcus sp. KACC 23699 TaxID=3149228 RepID=A0AAU7JYX3_9MICO
MRGPHRACRHGVTRHSARTNRTDNLAAWCGPHLPGTPSALLHGDQRSAGSGRAAAPRTGRAGKSFVRAAGFTPSDASTLLVYVMDVYDPWSYAYLPSVSAVLSAACSLVDVEIVHAGRYSAQPTSALAASVTEVRSRRAADFGPAFLAALESGSLQLDAAAAAAGMIALLASGDMPVSTVLGAVQHEFFVNGQPLEAPGVLGRVATRLGLDAPAIEVFAASERARELALEDFAVAKELDMDGGPLLLASRGDRLFEFDGLGATGERLVDQFRTVLAKP